MNQLTVGQPVTFTTHLDKNTKRKGRITALPYPTRRGQFVAIEGDDGKAYRIRPSLIVVSAA